MGGIHTARKTLNTRILAGLTLVVLGVLLPLSAMALAPGEDGATESTPALKREVARKEGGLTATAGIAANVLGQQVSIERNRAVSAQGADLVPAREVHLDTRSLPVSTDAIPVSAQVDLSLKGESGTERATTTAATTRSATQVPVTLSPALALLAGAAVAGLGLLVTFWSNVKGLLWKVFIAPLYAHIERGEVFDNPVREQIFGIVKADPGVSATEVARRAGVSWGTTLYHLNVLEQNRMVVSVKNGRYLRYFENGARTGAARETTMVLRNATTAKVAETVGAKAGMTQKELSDLLGMSPQALHWHLARLEKAGLLTKVKEGRVVRHYLARADTVVIAPAPTAAGGVVL